MNYFHKILIIFLSIILSCTARSKPGPEITLTKRLSFPSFGPNPNNLNQDITLLGSAAVRAETGCIQIPEPDLRSSAGRALYSSPVRLLDPPSGLPASFATTFSFAIQGPSGPISGPASGGLSFVLVPDELTTGRPGPWIGMLNDACEDDYKVVAVEFDTRMNPEFGDLNDNHVGINLGSIVSAAAVNASAAGVRLNDGAAHRAWINYNGSIKSFEIYLGPDGKARPNKPVFSGNIDLTPYLNEYMFVGFSGSTGDGPNTQIHSVFSWNFTATTTARLRLPSPESCASKIIVGDAAGKTPSKTPTSFYIFVAVVVLVLAIMINLFFNRKKRESYEFSDEIVVVGKEKARPGPPNRARKFGLAEIFSATRRFGETQMLGSDRNSVTYKGTLFNGCNVVVKRFSKEIFTPRGSVRKSMIKEVKTVGKLRHPNLVPIRGWCFDHQETIVVYEFVPNGSLDKWLFGFGVLPWTRRFKVVKDVGEALAYLHSKGLAHKNVKASSVFIDVSFRAILGDFGFVMSTTESTRFESQIGQKVDIFEFGVLILEVVSGRDRKSSPGELDLLDLAWALHESHEKSRLVDRSMGPVVNPDQAVRVLEVGLMCTLNDNKGRPSMEEVAEYLNFERPVPELPATRPVSLFPYSSTTGLCSGYSCASFK